MSSGLSQADHISVLFVHRWGAIMAGGELWLLNLIEQLAACRVSPSVALHIKGPLYAALREAEVPVRLLRLDFLQAAPRSALPGSAAALLRSAVGLCRQALASGVQLLHAFSPEAAEVGLFAARLARLPLVVTIHNCGPYHRFDRYVLRHSDRLIAISRAVERDLLMAGVSAERIARIPSGVAFEKLGRAGSGKLRRELGLGPHTPLIAMVATLEPKKAHEVLLRAAPAVLAASPDAHIALLGADHASTPAGPGPHELRLRALAHELQIAHRVHFLGFRPDAAELLGDCDLSVLCSRREALGLAAIESMALGVPIVATAVEGLREVVEDNRSGLLVPPDDPQRLAAAMTRLLGDRALAARLAATARAAVRQRFDAGHLAREHAALYRALRAGGVRSHTYRHSAS